MSDLVLNRALPIGPAGRQASGYWGMIFVIMTEASLFAYLLFSYYYLAIQPHQDWPPNGLPDFTLALPNTLILLASSAVVWWGERQLRRGRLGEAVGGLVIGIILGAVFMGVQLLEWKHRPFTITSSPYGSLYFVTTGFHTLHVIAGLLILVAVALWTALGYFSAQRTAAVSIAAIYWHFVDAVWVTVFFTYYLTPYLR